MPAVLLIDDEPRVGDALRFALERHGFTIAQELTAAAGHETARRLGPDCILLDVTLAEEDGLDACRLLKSDPATSSIPVLMLTGRVDPASTASGLDAGADDYLAKPFTPRELRARIDAQLRRTAG